MLPVPARARCSRRSYDAVVVGAGPNGLCAAVALAQQSLSVLLIEAAPTVGGGARTAELTLPGYRHDVCSAIHPLAVGSPFLRSLPLAGHGLKLIHPPVPLAHPLPDGPAALLFRSLAQTVERLGEDGPAWRAVYGRLSERWEELSREILGPLRLPRSPWLLARFGLQALQPADLFARARFRLPAAQALFAGCAAHSIVPLEEPGSASFGLVLGAAGHALGWPLAQGGSQAITDALASILSGLGGEMLTGCRVRSLDELPEARAVLFDVAPRDLATIAGDALPPRYARALRRFRQGPGIFKLDWALAGPIPWRDPACAQAATVHLGGTLEEVAESERAPFEGRIAARPFVLLAQQSLFDDTRAPQGRHTAWAYCHVPAGDPRDATQLIESQVERFAPGFRELILARSRRGPADLEAYDANCIGGDIGGGANDLWQLFARPLLRRSPYQTPNPALYLCSASTPPGGGVHGMCGYFGAQAALQRTFGRRTGGSATAPTER